MSVVALDRFLDPITDGAWSRALASRASAAAGPQAVAYGPGRGAFIGGEWVVNKGPSFHCSSWTAFLAGVATSRDAAWDNKGTLAPLDVLLETEGAWRYNGFTGGGYGGLFDRLGGKRALWRGEAARAACLEGGDGLLLFAQSSRKSDGSWRWWHHTGAVIVRDGEAYRIAADGSKGARGWSKTPMDVERFAPDAQKNLYWLWRLKASALRVSGAPLRIERPPMLAPTR